MRGTLVVHLLGITDFTEAGERPPFVKCFLGGLGKGSGARQNQGKPVADRRGARYRWSREELRFDFGSLAALREEGLAVEVRTRGDSAPLWVAKLPLLSCFSGAVERVPLKPPPLRKAAKEASGRTPPVPRRTAPHSRCTNARVPPGASSSSGRFRRAGVSQARAMPARLG